MYNVLPSVIYVYIFTLHGDGTVHVAVLVCDGERESKSKAAAYCAGGTGRTY